MLMFKVSGSFGISEIEFFSFSNFSKIERFKQTQIQIKTIQNLPI